MKAIIVICLTLIFIGVVFCVALHRSDVQECSASLSFPFKLELKFKKKEGKKAKKNNT